jgi:Protein of unknown function (DUF4232)
MSSREDNRGAGRLAWRPASWMAVAVICAGAAGCSSSSSAPATSTTTTVTATATAPAAPTGTVTATSTATSPAGPPACATSSVHVTQGTPQGYAGGVYQAIIFTNAGGASCTLYGYPGASLVSASHAQIGLAASRSSVTAVKLITLAPGATASAQLQIVDALNFPASTCNPVKAAYLRMYPPNQTVPVYLANASQTCSKPVQTLRISAVSAGSGS